MRAWCEISLNNLLYNVEQFKSILKPSAKLCYVIKTDAYGHGAVPLAEELQKQGADYFAVASLEEALELRENGIETPILILGAILPDTAEQTVEYNITATVYNKEAALALSSAAARQGKTAKIHIKIDTGMSRIGYQANAGSIEEILEISKLPGLELEGAFTHFACADEPDEGMTQRQFQQFCSFLSLLEQRGLTFPIRHCCNSAATMRFPQMHMDMVRVGISLYGLYPSDLQYPLPLRPLLQLKARVTNVKYIEKGESVSYGATYTAPRRMKLATVAIGYGDGYPRLLSNRGRVLVNGQYAAIVGRICMDQCMIDATTVNTISIGDEVLLVGAEGGLSIPLQELADIAGTIHYELACNINKRVPRYYIQDGKTVKVCNCLSKSL